MLQVDLRELARGPVETKAELARDDPLFEGVAVALADPVAVAGGLQATGDGRFYLHGSPRPPVSGGWRPCPPPRRRPGTADIGGLFPPGPPPPGGSGPHSLPPQAAAV